jgi:hypothetical protein
VFLAIYRKQFGPRPKTEYDRKISAPAVHCAPLTFDAAIYPLRNFLSVRGSAPRACACLLAVLAAAIWAASLAPSAIAATYTLKPQADAYVTSASPKTNFGTATELRASGSPTVRSYLRFDLAGVVGAVTSARLRLYVSSGSSLGYDVRGGNKSFNEKTVTYQNAPAVTAVVRSSGPLPVGWSEVDVTPLITARAASIAVTSASITTIIVASRENLTFSPALDVVTDTAPPAITLAAPAPGSLTNDRTPSFSGLAGTAPGDSTTVRVEVYPGAAATGPPQQTLTTTRAAAGAFLVDALLALADGTYTATAEQVDAAGNTGKSSANTFAVDATAPVLTLAAPASGSSTGDTTPAFSGTAGTAAADSPTVTVNVYAGTTATGTPLQTLSTNRAGDGSYSVDASSPLAGRTYTAQAEQNDTAGNLGRSSPNSFSVIDAAPVVSLTMPADGSVTNDSTPVFGGVAGTAAGDEVTVTVKVYSGAAVTGSPVQTLTATRAADGGYAVEAAAVADGTYTVLAEQLDDAGNLGRSSSATFDVDTAPPPVPTIASAPPNPSSSSSASFSFSSAEDGVGFLCRLDGAGFAGCTSPSSYTGLADGLHAFEVKARDAAGNQSAAETYGWIVDAPPRVTLTSPANGSSTADTTPRFSGAAGVEVGDSLTVIVKLYAGVGTGGTPVHTFIAIRDLDSAYSIDATTPLTLGTYTAQAEQSDLTSTGLSSANTFTVDTTAPPVPTTDSAPANPSNSPSASFSFSSTEAGVGFLCRVDGATFGVCTSPKTYTGIAEGQHTFEVKARDSAGNDSAAASHTWTVDTTAPVVTLTGPPSGSSTSDTTPSLTGVAGTSAGDAATVTMTIYAGSSATGTPVQTLTAGRGAGGAYSIDASPLAQGTYAAQSAQADAAGNTGRSPPSTFTVDTAAPTVTLTSPANGSSTSDTTPTFSGAAGTAPGDVASVTVSVYTGSSAAGTPVQTLNVAPGAGGAYSADVSPLGEGTYTAQSAQTDAAGNAGRSTANTLAITSVPAAGYRNLVMAEGPRGYWRLGERTGSTAADETASASTGTYLGGAALGVPGALSGDANSAIGLDGVDDNASIGDPVSGVLDFGTGDFSVEFWLRTAVNGEQAVLSKVPASGPSWMFTVSDDPGGVGMIRARLNDGSTTRYAYGPSIVDDNRWHHVVAAIDRDSGTTIYVDGSSSKFTAGAVAGSISNTGSLIVGGGGGYPYFRGDVDEVAVYSPLLSAARVGAHYDTALGGGGPSVPVVSLVAPAHGSSTSNTTPSFSGTASVEAGHSTTVTVKLYRGPDTTTTPVQTLTTTRAANGAYSVDSSPLDLGEHTARAEQSDGSGNVGYSSANTFSVTAPSAAVTMTLPANGSTVPDTTPTFVGQARSGNPNPLAVTVRIYAGGSATGTPTRTATATRDANGAWAVDSSPPLPAGTFTARAGQGSELSAPSTFSIVEPSPFPPTDPETVSAGDIAGCDTLGDEATALLLDQYPNAVVTSLGDHTYENGALAEFQNCYDPTWGRSKARTRPIVGNHEYNTPNAAGYYTYFNTQLSAFGTAATDPARGYYSYDLGSWHVVALNSNCSEVGGCDAGSAQEQWLRADLAAHPATCTLGLIHHPRFSSGGSHGNIGEMQAFWQALYDYNAELVLGGNDHDYERFAPQTPTGLLDVARGLSQFVVGTGGRGFYLFANGILKANSEVRRDDTFGVLKLQLHAGSYEWEFVPEAGKSFRDFGSRACH